jgi:hypothetical protein
MKRFELSYGVSLNCFLDLGSVGGEWLGVGLGIGLLKAGFGVD